VFKDSLDFLELDRRGDLEVQELNGLIPAFFKYREVLYVFDGLYDGFLYFGEFGRLLGSWGLLGE